MNQGQGLTLKALKLTNNSYVDILKATWVTLLILGIIVVALDSWFQFLNQFAEVQDRQDLIMMNNIGELLNGLLISATLIFLIPLRAHDLYHKQKYTHAGSFAKHTFIPLFLESLRVFASTLLWLLLLIIPGIFRYFRLYLVPFVVFFDPNYSTGSIDALKRSDQLIKGHTLFVAAILIVETVLTVGTDLLSKELIKQKILENWQCNIASTAFIILLSCYTFTLFYYFFVIKSESLKGSTDESHIQLAGHKA